EWLDAPRRGSRQAVMRRSAREILAKRIFSARKRSFSDFSVSNSRLRRRIVATAHSVLFSIGLSVSRFKVDLLAALIAVLPTGAGDAEMDLRIGLMPNGRTPSPESA